MIFDPEGDAVLPDDGFGDGTGDSVYAGLAARGRIRAVLLRGQLIVSGGVLVDDRRLGATCRPRMPPARHVLSIVSLLRIRRRAPRARS